MLTFSNQPISKFAYLPRITGRNFDDDIPCWFNFCLKFFSDRGFTGLWLGYYIYGIRSSLAGYFVY